MLNALTSFRFIAAFMVYLWHVGMLQKYQLGYVGVSFFFVLSGFIMSYNYISKFNNINKEKITDYYIARLAKIYPVHFLTFFISLPLFIHPQSINLKGVIVESICNITLIQSYIPIKGIAFDFNGVSWSLSDELFFYIVFPFLLTLLVKIKFNKSAYKGLSVAFLIWSTLLLITIACSNREVRIDDWLLYLFPLNRVFDFTIGIVMGTMFVSRSTKKVNITTCTILEIATLLFLFIWLIFSPNISQSFKFSVYYLPIWCLLIYIFALQGGIISRWLSYKRFVYLGEISFSFYMIHQLVIRYLHDVFHLEGNVYRIVSFVLSVLLSSVIYRYYEEPLRKKIRYGFKLRKKELKESHAL